MPDLELGIDSPVFNNADFSYRVLHDYLKYFFWKSRSVFFKALWNDEPRNIRKISLFTSIASTLSLGNVFVLTCT